MSSGVKLVYLLMEHLFLIKINLVDESLTTDLRIKPTYKHQCLHFSSSHLDHTTRSITCSQTLRISMICIFESDFWGHAKKMILWLANWGYSDWLFNRELRKAKHRPNNKSYS